MRCLVTSCPARTRRARVRQAFLALTALLVTLGGGCGRTEVRSQTAPPEVGVVTIATQRVVMTTDLPGRTSAYLVADVRPQVNGIIQQRAFTEGADVKAGSLLYQIDPAPYRAALEQAKASLALSEANLPALRSRAERLKELVAIHAVGQQDYDDAVAALQRGEASMAQAKAAVDGARINLEYTPVKSPISGRIGRSAVTAGALVTAYQPVPLAVVQQLDPIYVDVTQSSADILRLRRSLEGGHLKRGGDQQRSVRLLLEDGTPYAHEGTLQFRDVSVDPATGSVVLRMVFPNPDKTLLPGMFVRGLVEEGENDEAILAPQQGITRNTRGEPLALVVNAQGKVEQRILEVDRAIGSDWIVTKGLAAGERLIVEGMQKARPGASVRPVPAPASPQARAGQAAADGK